MAILPPREEPMTVVVIEDHVVVLGPDSVGLSITADCAEESGIRLIAAAREIKSGRLGPGPNDEG